MRHRLKQHLPAWREIGCSATVLEWIVEGFPLTWKSEAPPPHFGKNHPSAVEHEAFVTEMIQELLGNRTIIPSSNRPKVVSPLGVVPKAGNKNRLIWDGRYVNTYLVIPDLTYESLGHVKEILTPYSWMFTIDLKSGYHHLDMHPHAWEYLGFEWKGQFYCFTQLPFGLAPACWAFSMLTREVLGCFQRSGITCSGYIDDSIYSADDVGNLLLQQKSVLHTWEKLGFLVNRTKSHLTPTHSVRYLGMIADTERGCFLVPEDKRLRFISESESLLQTSAPVQVKRLASVKGQLLSMSWALGATAVRIFSRQLDLNILEAQTWEESITINPECRKELEFWRTTFDRFNGIVPMWGPTHYHTLIHTDAAGADGINLGGWGAWTLSHDSDESKSQAAPAAAVAKGRWHPAESEESSTWQELRAIYNALRSFHARPQCPSLHGQLERSTCHH